jgi:hypothetical protein
MVAARRLSTAVAAVSRAAPPGAEFLKTAAVPRDNPDAELIEAKLVATGLALSRLTTRVKVIEQHMAAAERGAVSHRTEVSPSKVSTGTFAQDEKLLLATVVMGCLLSMVVVATVTEAIFSDPYSNNCTFK